MCTARPLRDKILRQGFSYVSLPESKSRFFSAGSAIGCKTAGDDAESRAAFSHLASAVP